MSLHSYIAGDSAKRAKVRQFLKEAHTNGLKVEFLDGDPSWAAANMAAGKKTIDYFYSFNKEAKDKDEKFDGVQYDVEPYLLSDWSDANKKIEIWNGYIELMTYCQTKVDSLNDDTYFGAAIPRWFDNNPGVTYQKQLQDLIDYVAIMDYVDAANRLISDAGAEVAYASKIGKKVIVGVETQKIDPPTSTYYEEGWGNMEANIYETNEYFKTFSGYSGIAIHHYDYYKNFPQWGTSGKDINAPYFAGYSFSAKDSVFHLDVVDFCGSGVDMEKTFSKAQVLYASLAPKDTIKGVWKRESSSTFGFYPAGLKDLKGKYQFTFTAVDSAGNSRDVSTVIDLSITGVNVETGGAIIPSSDLIKNYPNPFNPVTNIQIELKEAGVTNISVYSITGQKVASLINTFLSEGRHEFQFDARRLASGMYFCLLNTPRGTTAKSILLLR
jgi:hypothetical protein